MSAAGAAFMLLACASGCRTYEAQPLELGRHLDQAEARLAEAMGDAEGSEPKSVDLSNGANAAECEVIALFFHRELRLLRARAGVARATAENAGLWQDPVFGLDAAQVLSPGDDIEYGAMLSVTFPVSGRLSAEKDLASAGLDAQLAAIVDAEWRVRNEVRAALYRWSALEGRAELLDGLLADAEAIRARAATLEEAGALGRAQLQLIEIELAERAAERIQLDLDRKLARLDVLSTMGLLPSSKIEFTPPHPPSGTTEEIDPESLRSTSTELAVMVARYEASEAAVRLAIQRQYPDLGLGLGPGSEDEDTRIVFGLSLPLPLWNRNRQEIEASIASRDAARTAAEITLERIVTDVRRAESTLRAVQEQRALIATSLRPLVDRQSETLESLAALGEINAFLTLETLGRRYGAAVRGLDLMAAEGVASAELRRLVGPAGESAHRMDASQEQTSTLHKTTAQERATRDKTP